MVAARRFRGGFRPAAIEACRILRLSVDIVNIQQYPDVDSDNIWSRFTADGGRHAHTRGKSSACAVWWNGRSAPGLARSGRFLERLWAAEPVLTGTGLFLAALLLASAFGIVVDPREITGAPAWLKPAKFAASTAIYSLTLAWIFTYLPGWTRTRRLVGRATALIFLIELAIIDWQAWRGTTSHFNIGTPLDATLFAVMGTGDRASRRWRAWPWRWRCGASGLPIRPWAGRFGSDW